MRRNILILLMILIVSVVSIFGYQTYQGFVESQEFNSYLESASLISSLHKQSSEQFESLLDFSEISREDFESIINNIVSNAKEAYEINSNISSEINRKERELLNLSVIYWLQGLVFVNDETPEPFPLNGGRPAREKLTSAVAVPPRLAMTPWPRKKRAMPLSPVKPLFEIRGFASTGVNQWSGRFRYEDSVTV
mgnify:CR=1 FL=1